jgi:hypothetical protein
VSFLALGYLVKIIEIVKINNFYQIKSKKCERGTPAFPAIFDIDNRTAGEWPKRVFYKNK